MSSAIKTTTVTVSPEEMDGYLATAKTIRAETMRGFVRRILVSLTDSSQRPQRLADV